MKRYGADRDKEIQRLRKKCRRKGSSAVRCVSYAIVCVCRTVDDSFQLAEDIVQDFFVAFWERKYYRAITGNFRSYLYTSVHNAALAVLKKKKLVPMELLTGVPVEIPQEAVLEREELERQEKELMLKLEKLPKQEIAAIKAVILENKKCVEAALELGMSVNTLKTHLARALKKLRKDYHLSFLFYSF